ncbi:MAG TPA: cytochrome d ubiquinol oxidase subunit II [Polyangia bacterium]|jgi:cytochrome d ubiquinol oxidase subunit II
MDLHATWFVLLGVLLAGYAILDGFDLGVGILHLSARGDEERRIFLNAIGPIWDGNEVWLITFGGALFAAFPEAYATVFSGFYLPFMLLLFALIFRAVSIEFRSKLAPPAWRRFWDAAFSGASLVPALLFGVAVGNALRGVPLDERGVFTGGLLDLLTPYPVLVGVTTVAMFAMHGALYLYLKVPHGPLHDRIRETMWHTWGVFLVLYILATLATLTMVPRAVPRPTHAPWAALVVTVSVLAIANIPRAIYHGRAGQAFLSSCTAIAALVALFSLALWPNLVTASNDPALSLTIYRAASSPKTLRIMFVIACIGMPLVATYTTAVYWIFRRRVELGPGSY